MKNTYRILVLEDERPLLEAIKIKLGNSNFEVVTARSVDSAVAQLQEDVLVDAIWLDHYLLGKENGLDFVALVKNNPKWEHIPIFVVSNTASPDKLQTYLRFGVHKYYTKSDYRLDDIIGDIQIYLTNQQD